MESLALLFDFGTILSSIRYLCFDFECIGLALTGSLQGPQSTYFQDRMRNLFTAYPICHQHDLYFLRPL